MGDMLERYEKVLIVHQWREYFHQGVRIGDVNPAAKYNGAWMHRRIHAPLFSEKSSLSGSHYAPMYSYNCWVPPNPPELLLVELDCHWLDGTTLLC